MNPEDIRPEIECSVCLQVPRNPIVYLCKNSHNICKACYDQLMGPKDCPTGRTCGFHLTDGVPQRNRTIEGMAGRWKHQCIYHFDGCSVTALVEQITEHEATCKFRVVQCCHEGCSFKDRKYGIGIHQDQCEFKLIPCKHQYNGCTVLELKNDLSFHEEECQLREVPCPIGDCIDTIVLARLDDHFKKNHIFAWFLFKETNQVEKVRWLLMGPTVDTFCWSLSDFSFDGHRFFRRFQKVSGIYYSWVYVIGGPRTANCYSCEYSVQDKKKKFTQTVKCPVVPIDFTVDQVMESGDYFVLTNDYVKKCMTDVVDNQFYKNEMWISYEMKKE